MSLVQLSRGRTPRRWDRGQGLRSWPDNSTERDRGWRSRFGSRIHLNKSLEQRLQ